MKLHSHPAAALCVILATSGGAIVTAIYAQVTSSLNGWEALVICVNAVLSVVLMAMKYRDQQIADARHKEVQTVATAAAAESIEARRAAVESTKQVQEVKTIAVHTQDLSNSRWAAMEAVIVGLRSDLAQALDRAARAESAVAAQAKNQLNQ